MTEATKRSIVRWIHIVFGIPIIGYIYSPFKELPNYASVVRYVALPAIALRGCGCGKDIFSDGLFQKLVRSIQSYRQQTNDYLDSYIDLFRRC